MLTVHKYPRKFKPVLSRRRPGPPAKDELVLTGKVQEKVAKVDEELFARALEKRGLAYWFRLNPTNIPSGLPGWVELDFLIEISGFNRYQAAGTFLAVEIDDISFIHRGQRKDADMVIKDIKRLEGLMLRGIRVPEVTHIIAADLKTQEEADRAVEKLLRGAL